MQKWITTVGLGLTFAQSITFGQTPQTEKPLSGFNADEIKEGLQLFDNYLQERKKIQNDPSAAARVFYQSDVDSKPCEHCPSYLNLTLEVNKIAEKIKNEGPITETNKSIVSINKLNFMYYVVRSESENGIVTCKTTGELTKNPLISENGGKLNMVVDEMISLPNITSLQYIPEGQEEVFYYYRGEGLYQNVVIEVAMKKDGTARLRYYRYENQIKPHLMLSSYENTIQNLDESQLQIKKAPAANFGKEKTVDVTDSVNIKMKLDTNPNQQSAKLSVEDIDGKRWVVLEGRNQTQGNRNFITIVPVSVSLKNTGLKIDGEFTNFIEQVPGTELSNFQQNQTLDLRLSNNGREYINVKTFRTAKGEVLYNFSNTTNVAEKTIYNSYNTDSSGNKNYELSVRDSDNNSFAATYNSTASGDNRIGLKASKDIDEVGKLSTEYSRSTSSDKGSFAVTFEKNIGKFTTMVLTAKRASDEYTVYYQVQKRW